MSHEHLEVAIVGMGPRGLSVLERLIARLAAAGESRPVRIRTIDPGEPGAGRIWRTDQPLWLLMNTAAGEVSLYSGEPDGGPWRAGAGPSLHAWLCEEYAQGRYESLDDAEPSSNTYAPRRVYGRYLRDVFRHITANLPAQVTVEAVQGRVGAVRRGEDGGYVLSVGGRPVRADRVVLATGHPRTKAGALDRDLLDFASRHRGVRYLRGDSAADMDLDFIEAGQQVAVLGLGLTFYDVAALLTLGRGGRYEQTPDGQLVYHPSGKEPHLVAGSRSGLPLLARGRNQKDAHYRYTPLFFSSEAVAQARADAMAEAGTLQLRFRQHVLPLVLREVEHVYYRTHISRRDGETAAQAFTARYQGVADDPGELGKLLADTGLSDVPPIDLEAMARPFSGEEFTGPDAFHERLLAVLRSDAAEAEAGNVDGPLKAALDILRDTRGVMREAVEFSSLHPESQRDEFLRWFNPINTMVSAGPPSVRIRQTVALIEAGVLTVAGPDLRIETDEDAGQFVLSSPRVQQSATTARVLIDARIPPASLTADASPLMRQLVADSLASPHVNISPRDGARFTTGALAVTGKPFRVVDAAGRPAPGLYALGIPTEELRWFTQIGNGRPGPMVAFHSDADAIAADLLAEPRRPGHTQLHHNLPATRLPGLQAAVRATRSE
ncbi:FAD/NAD(P)-binding protein [Streptacidiphilus sp. MAP5-3]|uniref:FAD/NAD(P)-binding protein n=1 Tax=unclassified Streptacidiphilus TaxID=2643834 RepID=UPI0035144779